MKESTCGNCEHIQISYMCGTALAGCNLTGFVVPHTSELVNGNRGDDSIVTFTRIPLSCPREDTEKSENSVKKKDFIIKRFGESYDN